MNNDAVIGRIRPADSFTKEQVIELFVTLTNVARPHFDELLYWMQTESVDAVCYEHIEEDGSTPQGVLISYETLISNLESELENMADNYPTDLLEYFQKYFSELDEYSWDDECQLALKTHPGRSLAY